MKKKMYGAAAVLLIAGILGGCGETKEVPLHQMEVDKYVTLGDYKSLSVSVEPYEVGEEECREILASIYAQYADRDSGTVERAVMNGDTANIDYEGRLDGVAFEGGTDQGADLTIGSGQFIPGFEEGLIGAMPGEERELTLTFPEGYKNNPDLAGKETVFTVTVNYVIPGNEEDMQDAVVEKMEFDGVKPGSVAELKQYINEMLEEEAAYYYENDLENAILEELDAQSVFQQLPAYMVEAYREQLTRGVENAAAQYGVTADAYTSYYYGMTCEQFVAAHVEDSVRQNMALQAIANAENLRVEDAELDEKLQKYADEGGYGSVEEFMGNTSREEYRNYFMSEKVLDYLKENMQ